MADDIQPITGTPAKAAGRLCNFPTAEPTMLLSHQKWLDSVVKPAVANLPFPWVDLVGYASRKGDAEFNRALSFNRCEAVKTRIDQYAEKTNFQMEWAKGETESTGAESNDDGYWRAVDVLVYAGPVPAPKPAPLPKSGATQFAIGMMEGISVSVPLRIPGAQLDYYSFVLVDRERALKAELRYVGASLSLPSFAPFSLSAMGPVAPFTTTQPVDLADFEGPAALFQDPGLSIGSASLGALRITFESERLLAKKAAVRPSIIEVPGPSFSLGGLGSAGVRGKLTVGPITPLDN